MDQHKERDSLAAYVLLNLAECIDVLVVVIEVNNRHTHCSKMLVHYFIHLQKNWTCENATLRSVSLL